LNHIKGVRPRPLTCGKGKELKQSNRIKVIQPRLLTCGKGGELKQLKLDKGCSTQADYLW